MVQNFTSLMLTTTMLCFLITMPLSGQEIEGYYASKVTAYNKGYLKGGLPFDERRVDPTKALGGPDNDVTYNFVSLGFTGELAVSFAAPVKNGQGADILIHETSFYQTGKPCESWPEKAEVFVSQDNENWYFAGAGCRSAEFFIPDELPWIIYVKVVDASNPMDSPFDIDDDGYDVNSVEALHGPFNPVIPLVECVQINPDGSYLAFMGYDNQESTAIEIPIGPDNYFSTSANLGQPESFLPGVHESAFYFSFDGSETAWTLISPDSTSRTATVSASSAACPFEKPTAHLSGDTVICNAGAPVDISVELTGTAPWTISYRTSLGVEKTISGITSPFYSFETRETTTFSLIRVSDFNGEGVATGSATISLAEKPAAILTGGGDYCGAEPQQLSVRLKGNAPWNFSLLKNGDAAERIQNWEQETYTTNISESGIFTIGELSDASCPGEPSLPVSFTFHEIPSAVISGGGTVCGAASAEAEIRLSGTGPFDIEYSNGEKVWELNGVTTTIVPLQLTEAGEYRLISVSNSFCDGLMSGIASVEHKALPEIEAEIPLEVCFGEIIRLSSISNETASYIWTSDGAGNITTAADGSALYQPATNEKGEIHFILRAQNECGATEKTFSSVIADPLDPGFSLKPETPETFNPVLFTPNEKDADEYSWNLNDETIGKESLQYTFLTSGSYPVTLSISKNGCDSSLTKIINVQEKKVLYVPNVFSPTASNPENRVVKVYGYGLSAQGFLFKIVNRWGNTLYETTDLSIAQNQGWNGKAKNGELQALGVYTYVLKGMFLDGEKFEKTGPVTLIN